MTTETSGYITTTEQNPGMPPVNRNDSWNIQWDSNQQKGTIGAVNTKQVGDGPVTQKETFRPFQNKEDIQYWLDTMRNTYFGHRTKESMDPNNQLVPIEKKAYDDSKDNALVERLEFFPSSIDLKIKCEKCWYGPIEFPNQPSSEIFNIKS